MRRSIPASAIGELGNLCEDKCVQLPPTTRAETPAPATDRVAATFRPPAAARRIFTGLAAIAGALIASVAAAAGPGASPPLIAAPAKAASATATAPTPRAPLPPLFEARPIAGGSPANRGPLDRGTFVELASRLSPAVVWISSTRLGGDEGERRIGRGQGTGVLLNSRGYLLTNNHVIQSSVDIRVRLHDERDFPAQVIGSDERTDLALLKIDPGKTPLRSAYFGDSENVRIGDWVLTIGNPFGLDHSVTAGIVSAKGRRDVQPEDSVGFFDFIQTDAPIHPGSSGGPLINTRGEVIGINTAMRGSGVGFAIPSNIARSVVEQLARYGRVQRSWLGVYPQPISEQLRKAFRLPDRSGALLSEVYNGSPAQRAGLLPGDVIVDWNGKRLRRADDLVWLLGPGPQSRATVRYYRDGQPRSAEIEFPPPEPSAPTAAVEAPRPATAFGFSVTELNLDTAKQMEYDGGPGLVIMNVEPGSPAMQAGTERGDVILQVNRRPVTSLDEYAVLLREVAPGEIVRLLVRRKERKQWHNLWIAFQRR